MTNYVDQFKEVMRLSELEPPETIEPGKVHRFPGIGKSDDNKSGWCHLFPDGIGGAFGDWSNGLSDSWQANREKPYTHSERIAFKKMVAETKKKTEAELKIKQVTSSERAKDIWDQAKPALHNHPYLLRKGISAHGVRLHNDELVIPLNDGEKICSLQFISPNGDKRFQSGGKVKGCYFLIDSTERAEPISITKLLYVTASLCLAQPLYLVEGFATGATIHEATGHTVVVAFNAGNLEPVAQIIRDRSPRSSIIVCADDDYQTDGNPGLTNATTAAQGVQGSLAIPDFGSDRPDKATDFNDLASHLGLDAVCNCIENASIPEPEEWEDPLPMTTGIEAEAYPVDALPPIILSAVEEVQAFTQAPIALVAGSALSAVSLAVQAYFDVARSDKLTGPTSLFLLTIAASGERKSTCDKYFTQMVREYQEQMAKDAKPELRAYRANLSAWEAQHGGIKDKIRKLARDENPVAEQQKQLLELEVKKPDEPKVPKLIRGDETPESLAWALSHEWPSGGVVSAEAGVIFGAHGMGKDSIMRNLGLLNILWDGGELPIGRRTSESFTLKGARLTVALQIQAATLQHFFEQSGGLARGTGFMSRFLIAYPKSTQGSRSFTEPSGLCPAMERFNGRMSDILAEPVPICNDGMLYPAMLSLSPEAKSGWIEFYNKVETELCDGGEFCDIRDVASKSADNAVRLAALFQAFEAGNSGDSIESKYLEGASRLATWYLKEAERFFGEALLSPETMNAIKLERWLVDYCKREGTHVVSRNHVQQYGAGKNLRNGESLSNSLQLLAKLNRTREIKNGRKKEIHINPKLLT